MGRTSGHTDDANSRLDLETASEEPIIKVSTNTQTERSRVKKILSEHALQQSGLIDSNTAIRIGKLVGVQAVIVGEMKDYVSWNNISGYGSTVSSMIRMIDTESGKVVFNSAISRVRPFMDTFPNAQLTAKEIVDGLAETTPG